MTPSPDIRPPAVAGMFYENSAAKLQNSIDDLLSRVQNVSIQGRIVGLVSPHAGYIYSGFTAAHAYKLIQNRKYECVIIVGPNHREYFDGVSIYPGTAYETPLGTISIHQELRDTLISRSTMIKNSQSGHTWEHSLEVQLPFLQRVLGGFQFVPIVMGDQLPETCLHLAQVLVEVIGKKDVLFIASSDLSHYHPYKEAVKLDKLVIDEIEKFDVDSFLQHTESDTFEACGSGPIAVVMQASALLGANLSKILHYSTSGDTTGDKSAVVGYVSAAFIQAV
jgi:MEMO1 family protein